METSHLVRFKTIVTSVIGVIKAKELSICIRCVARYCNIMKVFNSKPETLEHDLVLLFPDDEQAKQLLTESRFCSSCLNSLTDEFVKAQADELIGKIEAEKDVTTFQLHISLPAIMTLRNEYFARLFGTEKDYISQKELFRVLLSNQLVSRLNVTYNPQSNLVIGMDSIVLLVCAYKFTFSCFRDAFQTPRFGQRMPTVGGFDAADILRKEMSKVDG